MTAEEVFCDLFDKYGKDFTWHMIPLSQADGTLVEELKKKSERTIFCITKGFGRWRSVNQTEMYYMSPAMNSEGMCTIFFH